MATFYDQVVPMADGTELSMADMKGKADGKVINQVVAELCK